MNEKKRSLDPKFPERIRFLAQREGISLAELARRVGISNQSIQGYLNAVSIPDAAICLKMASTLGATIEYFLTGIDSYVYSDLSTHNNELTSVGGRLIEYRKMSQYTQDFLAEILSVDVNDIASYEQNLKPPSVDFLQKLAYQGADIAWIVTGCTQDPGPVSPLRNQQPAHNEISPTPHQTAQIDTKQQSLPNEISSDPLAQARLEGESGSDGGGAPLVSISHRGSKQAAFSTQTSHNSTAVGTVGGYGIGGVWLFWVSWAAFAVGRGFGRAER